MSEEEEDEADRQRRARVIGLIAHAFADVERGSGISMRESRALDAYGSESECAQARLLDTDTRWQDIPDASIEHYHDILTFLDAKGFRYYAPAYMIWALRNIDTTESVALAFLLYAFNLPPDGDYWRQHLLKKWALFTVDQCSSICAFLRLMRDEGGDYAPMGREALTNYWGQFCKPEACGESD